MRVFKKIFIFFGAILLMVSSLSAEIPDEEKDALEALYDSTNGGSWSDSENWKIGDPCANVWTGVDCRNDSIVGLDLSTNQLIGSIPSEIGDLRHLEYLYLEQNQLTGSIPPEIGDLINLEELHLDQNQLTGSIPSAIGSLENLTVLWLDENQLTGSIPPEITNLTLTSLYLSSNCNLYSGDTAVEEFIDDVGVGDTYQDILDTNTHDCVILVPVIMYLLN